MVVVFANNSMWRDFDFIFSAEYREAFCVVSASMKFEASVTIELSIQRQTNILLVFSKHVLYECFFNFVRVASTLFAALSRLDLTVPISQISE